MGLLLSLGCEAAGPLPSYPSLYTRSNYSSICDSMQKNGDTAGQIVCGWYINDLKRGAEPNGLLYWRGRLAAGEDAATLHNLFVTSASYELSGSTVPIK